MREKQLLTMIIIFFMGSILIFSQEDTKIQIFHGKEGKSTIYQLTENGDKTPKEGKRLVLVKPINNEIRVEVINCNHLFYNYSFTSKIDSFKAPNINIAQFTNTLSSITSKPSVTSKSGFTVGANSNNDFQLEAKEVKCNDTSSQINKIMCKIEYLEKQYEMLKEYIKDSEEPNYTLVTKENRTELEEAINKIAKIGKNSDVNVNNNQLKEDVENWFKDIDKKNNNKLINIIKTYSLNLINEIQSYKKEIAENVKPISEVFKVNDGITTIKLNVSFKNKEDQTRKPNREIGANVVEIIIKSEYERPTVELVPVAYSAYSRDITNYDIKNGVVTEEHKREKFNFRVGGMLSLNFYNFGERKEFGTSIGLGSNIFGGGTVFSEFFLGGFLSYRDKYRVGIGWGMSNISEKLKSGAIVGQTLPQNSGLSDYIEKEEINSWFLIFSVTGLTFPIF